MAQTEGSASLLPPLILLVAALAGFTLSNSPFAALYADTLHVPFLLSIGTFELLNKSALHLVNDGLMAVFFLFIGLELKREILVGELSNVRNAMLPIFGAIGGMVCPALLYFFVNSSGEASQGWGIPMATDIAFALGLVALLGSRVPPALKILLAAIAIVDDLGAILVIAIFYTSSINLTALGLAFGFLAMAFLMNRAGVTKVSVYLLAGIPLWYFMLKSGVHATIAGVLLASAIPMTSQFQKKQRKSVISDIFDKKISQLDSPAVFLEKSLNPWVSFLIIPVFAFCNAGVSLGSITFGSISFGIVLGLVIGKPVGIAGAAFIANKLGLAALPKGTTWPQLIGLGSLAGIGFTMSLFISSLAFSSEAMANESKFAILVASLISGTLGTFLLLRAKRSTVHVN